MTRADLAAELEAARRGRFTIASRKAIPGALSIDAAYALGEDLERERVSAGWRPAGWKLGFTNQALWSKLAFADAPRSSASSPGRARSMPCIWRRRSELGVDQRRSSRSMFGSGKLVGPLGSW